MGEPARPVLILFPRFGRDLEPVGARGRRGGGLHAAHPGLDQLRRFGRARLRRAHPASSAPCRPRRSTMPIPPRRKRWSTRCGEAHEGRALARPAARRPVPPPGEVKDWTSLIALARAESLAGSLAWRLEGQALPPRVEALLDAARRDGEAAAGPGPVGSGDGAAGAGAARSAGHPAQGHRLCRGRARGGPRPLDRRPRHPRARAPPCPTSSAPCSPPAGNG